LPPNADQLTEIQSEIQARSGTALIFPADVTDAASIKDAFAQIKSQLDAPSVLVYNAGAFKMAGILELTPEQFENSWKVNCFGAFLAAQQVLPAMVEQGRGTILLTGATAALKGSARFSALAVGKFGLRALAQSLAREFGPQGIHVAHIVIDGMINTEHGALNGIRKESTYTTFTLRRCLTTSRSFVYAQNYWQLYNQDATAWTLELDLRPAVEKF
jgi:NAD(P)-dependent dehydrogenase (short-subunit alcohol dehydrogenase family)